MPRQLKPSEKRNDVRAKYGNSSAWRVFCNSVRRSKFMIDELLKEQGGNCPVCNMPISPEMGKGNFQVHHTDYNNTCKQHTTKFDFVEVRYSTPTRARRARAPHCEKCKRNNPEYFHECISRLVVVHPGCHGKIHFGKDSDFEECEI